MKKIIVLIIVSMVIGIGFLSGCTQSEQSESKKTIYNLGDSITVENIKYTFLSAKGSESWGGYTYNLEIKGENLAKEEVTGYVAVIKYEMENGYSYEHNEMFSIGTKFTINPGKTQTKTIISSGEIDKDFLPVAKIYIEFRKEGSNPLSYVWIKSIVINV